MRLAQQALALGVLPQHGFQLLECLEHLVGPGPAPVVVLVRHCVLCSSSPRFAHAVRSHQWPTCSGSSNRGPFRADPEIRTTSPVRHPMEAAHACGVALPIPETARLTHDAGTQARTSLLPGCQRLRRTDEPCPNRPWLAVTATRAPSTWCPVAVPRSCQTHSQTWAIAWAGMASPKHERPPEGLTGTRPPRRRGAVAEQLLRLALAAQADVLVPVELERGREVVDLGQADVLGADPGLGVGRRGDGRPEARGGRCRIMRRPSRRPSRSRSSASR